MQFSSIDEGRRGLGVSNAEANDSVKLRNGEVGWRALRSGEEEKAGETYPLPLE